MLLTDKERVFLEAGHAVDGSPTVEKLLNGRQEARQFTKSMIEYSHHQVGALPRSIIPWKNRQPSPVPEN